MSAPRPNRRPRRRRLAALLLAGAIVIAAVGLGRAHARPGAPLKIGSIAALSPSRSSHIVVIVMENKENSDILGSSSAPYANRLARRYGVATQSYAITHPSLPNYLALTSGATDGINSDCTSCRVSATNLVDQLEQRGISWKAYLEGVPSACFTGAGAGGYAKRHNPFIYYTDIAGSSSRCGRLVGFNALASDLRSQQLPTFAWITPNLCDDTHDCGVGSGDAFLARTVPALRRELGPRGFIVITWDEGSSNAGCCRAARGGHVATIVVGPTVRQGARDASPVDHYGVLATVEQALGLPALAGAASASAGRLSSLFRSAPSVR